MATPKKFELFKKDVLQLCPSRMRRNVVFSGPEKRKDNMKISVGHIDGLNIDVIQRRLRGCQVYLRSNIRGGNRLDVYVPCKVAPLAVRRLLQALLAISWSAFGYLLCISKGRA